MTQLQRLRNQLFTFFAGVSVPQGLPELHESHEQTAANQQLVPCIAVMELLLRNGCAHGYVHRCEGLYWLSEQFFEEEVADVQAEIERLQSRLAILRVQQAAFSGFSPQPLSQ